MKECDKRNNHISNKFHMIYISRCYLNSRAAFTSVKGLFPTALVRIFTLGNFRTNILSLFHFHTSVLCTNFLPSLSVCFWRDSPPVGQGLLTHEVSRSHTATQHGR